MRGGPAHVDLSRRYEHQSSEPGGVRPAYRSAEADHAEDRERGLEAGNRDAATEALMREIPHIHQIWAYPAAKAAIDGYLRFILAGGKKEEG